MNVDNFTSPSGMGYIIVNVTTARGAIPIEGATVRIHDYSEDGENNRGDVITVEITNSSGATPRISLPAPPRELSLSPGNGAAVYETYTVDVMNAGYYDQSYINVPIFDGITAIQNVDLVPLPEYGISSELQQDKYRFIESENPNL